MNASNEDNLYWKITSNIILQYLNNHWSDLNQIVNISLNDQTNVYKWFKWRQPPMEDDLQIFKLEYLSIHLSDLTQIWNLSLGDQAKVYECFKW
jgi:hypothetical protein